MIVLFELVGFPFEMNGLGCPCRLAMFCFLVLNVCCLPVFCYLSEFVCQCFVWLMYFGMGRRLHGEMIALFMVVMFVGHCIWLILVLDDIVFVDIVFGRYC